MYISDPGLEFEYPGSIRIWVWYFKARDVGYSGPDSDPITKIRSGSGYLDSDPNPTPTH